MHRSALSSSEAELSIPVSVAGNLTFPHKLAIAYHHPQPPPVAVIAPVSRKRHLNVTATSSTSVRSDMFKRSADQALGVLDKNLLLRK